MQKTMVDKVSLERIARLHPKVRNEVQTILQECNNALKGRAQARIAQGLRTFAEQNALYAQGRTTSGKKVTNAKAGESIHNYGFAVDLVLIIDGKEASWDIHKDWDADGMADWDECVKIFAKYEWGWGGSWQTFKDFPHFDKIGYNNWRTLQGKPKDANGYVIL